MAQPTSYAPTTDFSQDEANSVAGRSTVGTAKLDTEFSNISTTINQIISNLALIQRDDTKLNNDAVHPDALDTSTLALIASTWVPRGAWASDTDYAIGNIAEENGQSYVCHMTHNSGISFNTTNWTVLSGVSTTDFNSTVTNIKSTIDLDRHGLLAPHKNLIVQTNDFAFGELVDVDADQLMVEDDSGNRVVLTNVDITIDIRQSGVNGLDAGVEAADTWYHIWIIYDGVTVAGVFSASSTAPTMPPGYTYKAYVGAKYNDSGSNLYRIYQRDNVVTTGRVLTLNGGVATIPTAITLQIPPTARKMRGGVRGADNSGAAGLRQVDLGSTGGYFFERFLVMHRLQTQQR